MERDADGRAARTNTMEQMSLFDYTVNCGGCGNCVCCNCLYLKTSRDCPKGGFCYDDWRAINDPWRGKKRNGWTNCDKPGEQEHWCRGGVFYGIIYCDKYVPFDKSRVKFIPCLGATIEQFQDGYQWCPLLEPCGCEYCYERFETKIELEEEREAEEWQT